MGWVASTGAASWPPTPQELAASVPRLAATGPVNCALLLPLAERGEVEAVVVLVRRVLGRVLAGRRSSSRARSSTRRRPRSRSCGPAPRPGTDAVTGCMNHRAMRRRLDEEIGRAMRTGGPLSCLLIDLDDFKLVNDRHGHPAGDAMLRERRPGARRASSARSTASRATAATSSS